MWETLKSVKDSWVVAILGAYLAIAGTIGFAEFIAEECMQCTTFAAFAYQNSKDWEGLEMHLNGVMKPVHRSASFFIRYIGWINPLMWSPYLDYVKANEAYILSMEKRIIRARSQGEWGGRRR